MLEYAVVAILGPLFFVLGRMVAQRGRVPALGAYTVLLVAMVGKAVLHHRPDWEHNLFPWPWYVEFQVALFYPLALLCLGLATGFLVGRNRRAIFVLSLFVWGVGLYTERWLFAEPDGSSTARATADHHCAQSTPYSCGPAATVSLLSLLGRDANEGEMMMLCRTPVGGGTSLFRIAAGLRRKLGGAYAVKIVRGEPAALRRLGVPAVVSVWGVHVITVYFEGDDAVLLDPALPGPKRMPFSEYQKKFAGFAVVALPH